MRRFSTEPPPGTVKVSAAAQDAEGQNEFFWIFRPRGWNLLAHAAMGEKNRERICAMVDDRAGLVSYWPAFS